MENFQNSPVSEILRHEHWNLPEKLAFCLYTPKFPGFRILKFSFSHTDRSEVKKLKHFGNKSSSNRQKLDFKKGMVIASLNISGLNTKVKLYLIRGYTLWALMELNISPSLPDNIISIDGYSIIAKDRNEWGGGGVVLQFTFTAPSIMRYLTRYMRIPLNRSVSKSFLRLPNHCLF